MTKPNKQLKRIINKVNDRILLAYVIWFIKVEELRSKLETWTCGMDKRIKDRD